jgi:hypothetical protein
MKATEGIGGSVSLSTCPTASFTTIRDVDFLKAVRLHLGIPPVVNFPAARCPARALSGPHLLSCTALMHCNGASSAGNGHGLVGCAIAHHLRAAGVAVNFESQHPKPSWRTRPDLPVFDATAMRFLTDLTIINSVATSRRGQQVSKTIERVDRKKRQNYRSRPSASMLPSFPCCSRRLAFGYVPDIALDFLSFVSVTGNELHLNSWPNGPRGLRAAMLASVSCALQKRNADIIAISAQRVLSLARRSIAVAIP